MLIAIRNQTIYSHVPSIDSRTNLPVLIILIDLFVQGGRDGEDFPDPREDFFSGLPEGLSIECGGGGGSLLHGGGSGLRTQPAGLQSVRR